jgi:hypothetical protein
MLAGAAQHCIKPTAPVARASGGETRFGACLLAKGLSTQSARRLMLVVSAPPKSADATIRYSFALWFAGFARQGPGCRQSSRPRRHVIETATGARDGLQLRGRSGGAWAVGSGCGVVLQVAEGVANYGVNPTRLAPQTAAGNRAWGRGLWCGGWGRRRRAGYAYR